MSDLPLALAEPAVPAFLSGFDRAGKIVRGLDALGPIAGRDVVVVDARSGPILDGLIALGARLRCVPLSSPLVIAADPESADVVIGLWSAFRGVEPNEMDEVDRVLRPGGRHLVVHDYGRDDVSRLYGERLEYGTWSDRRGPFLKGGFRVRVLHCFWEFESRDSMSTWLSQAFGEAGAAVASTLSRPRLRYNVAIYHRSRP